MISVEHKHDKKMIAAARKPWQNNARARQPHENQSISEIDCLEKHLRAMKQQKPTMTKLIKMRRKGASRIFNK